MAHGGKELVAMRRILVREYDGSVTAAAARRAKRPAWSGIEPN